MISIHPDFLLGILFIVAGVAYAIGFIRGYKYIEKRVDDYEALELKYQQHRANERN